MLWHWASPGSPAPGARLPALRTFCRGCPDPGAARLPPLWRLSRLPCESAFGERAPWQCTRWERAVRQSVRDAPRTALLARKGVHYMRRLWEESNISAVRGANAPSKDESEASAESLAPPPTTSRNSTDDPVQKHFKALQAVPRCRRSTGCPTPARAPRGAARWGSRPCECSHLLPARCPLPRALPSPSVRPIAESRTTSETPAYCGSSSPMATCSTSPRTSLARVRTYCCWCRRSRVLSAHASYRS